MTSRVAGVVLAAGRSTRFAGEGPKQLLELDGEPMVRRVVRTALASTLAEVIVVLGFRADAVRGALEGLDVQLVTNPEYADGQSTSVRAGIAALSAQVSAALFLPADQAGLRPETIDRLIAASQSDAIVVPMHGGRRSSPVLFGREFFDEIGRLRGDTGGRALLADHHEKIRAIHVDDPVELADIDTVADFERFERHMGQS